MTALFALPAAYFMTDSFMQFFAVRPESSMWVVVVTLIVVLGLAGFTTGTQTIRAALLNPVDNLSED